MKSYIILITIYLSHARYATICLPHFSFLHSYWTAFKCCHTEVKTLSGGQCLHPAFMDTFPALHLSTWKINIVTSSHTRWHSLWTSFLTNTNKSNPLGQMLPSAQPFCNNWACTVTAGGAALTSLSNLHVIFEPGRLQQKSSSKWKQHSRQNRQEHV